MAHACQRAVVLFSREAAEHRTEQNGQSAGGQRGETEDQRDEKKDGDPSIEWYGQPSNGSEPLRHIPFDPRRLDFIIEPGDLLQHAGGEQPNGVALTSLHTVQKYLDIAGRAFDKTDTITVGEPIVKISVRLVTEAIQAREELAVQNDATVSGPAPAGLEA